ncbi:MAG: domain S-box [Acidimicrobiales bacterium]|nr:domain S-box [Acidimicrobiales bacterium]
MKGGLTSRMVIASALLTLMVGGAFAVLLVAIANVRSASSLARHSEQVLSAANQLERLVIDVETGQRGFLLTSDARFLQPWSAAQAAIPDATNELIQLTVVPDQDNRARRLQRAILSYVDDYAIPLVAAARRGDPAARDVASALEGKQRVDDIRAQFDGLVAAERKLATTRQDRSGDAARRATLAASLGLAGSVVLIVGSARYLTGAIVRPVRSAAAMAGRLAAGDLAVRMPETGTAEIGALERSFNTMGSSLEANHEALGLLADEQAALRRVATLIARAVAPDEIFAAVAAEVGRLFGARNTLVARFEPDGATTIVAALEENIPESSVGARRPPEETFATTAVWRSGRAVRFNEDYWKSLPGPIPDDLRRLGIRSIFASPIVVEGRVWGAMVVTITREPPEDTAGRVAEFTELVATAIANADSRAELSASRARVVAAADDARRRIERDLHDGAQQRLVSLGLELRTAEDTVPPELELLKARLSSAASGLADVIQDLQEISRGIHPAILSKGGLGPALRTLARRSPVPVEIDSFADGRLPERVETAAYYVVSEALTNAAKHARASVVHVAFDVQHSVAQLSVRDDGVGGAEPAAGTGLIGLRDRVEALGGRVEITSPAGHGTSLLVRIPIDES